MIPTTDPQHRYSFTRQQCHQHPLTPPTNDHRPYIIEHITRASHEGAKKGSRSNVPIPTLKSTHTHSSSFRHYCAQHRPTTAMVIHPIMCTYIGVSGRLAAGVVCGGVGAAVSVHDRWWNSTSIERRPKRQNKK